MSRFEMRDEDLEIETKTPQQIKEETELFNELFSEEPKMTTTTATENPDAELKAAMQENNQDAFKALLAKKKAEAPVEPKALTGQKHVSLNFGVVGSGQAGGRLAECFYNLDYPAVAINTAVQDLELLDLPAANKFHMNFSIGGGGSGKNLDVGRDATEAFLPQIRDFISDKLKEPDVYLAVFSLGGGSGSGSAETLVNLLHEFERPVCVIAMLPGSFDDTQSKYNAIQTLSRLADQASSGKINSLILVDNAQIEKHFHGLSQADFWKVSNELSIKPLHTFNQMSARPSRFESLDSMDLTQALLDAGGCTIFGSNVVPKEKYEASDLSLVEAIIDNMENGLLASGFDLKQAQKVGVLVTASEEVLSKIPHSSISFIFKYISEEWGSTASFRGVYPIKSNTDDITIHFVFSGLGLPRERVESLKAEAQKSMDGLLAKRNDSAGKMVLDLGKEKNASAADTMMEKIKKNKSAVGKLLNQTKRPIDRRR